MSTGSTHTGSVPARPVDAGSVHAGRVSVRLAHPHEAAALADLAARTFPLANPPGADPANIAAFIANNLTAAHFAAYAAHPNARLIVAALPHIADDSPPSSAPVSSVVVESGGVELDAGERSTGEQAVIEQVFVDQGVVEHDGVRERLVGYSLIFAGPDGEPDASYSVRHTPSVYLSKFYVDPLTRGGIVSTPLMGKVREVAASLGGRSLWLAVNQLNERATHFYEKSGFQRVGVKTMQIGEQTFDDFVYELTL